MPPSKIIGSSSKHGFTDTPNSGIDWLDTAVNGGSLLLNIVSDASKLAPIPFLQQAAGITVKIVQTVQAVKDNKMAFRRIAHQAMELVAAIYQAYERSTNKPQWPPREINVVIEELLNTLQSIYELVEKQLSRAKYKRFLSSAADLQTIGEYRERLQASVNKFEIASHLSIHDTLSLVVKSQIQAQEQHERERMAQAEQDRLDLHRRRLEEEARIREREEARMAQQASDDMLRVLVEKQGRDEREREEKESGETHDAIMRIHYVTDVQLGERERIRAAENEEREREIRERAVERERTAREDQERLTRLQAEERANADLVRQLKEEAEVERRRLEVEMYAFVEKERKAREALERGAALENRRLREELERAQIENQNGKGKGKRKDEVHNSVVMEAGVGRYRVQVKKQPASMKATVETDDDDNDDSEQTISDEEEIHYSESSIEETPAPPPLPKKKKKKAPNRPDHTKSDQNLRQQLLALGIDLDSIQNRGTSVTAGAGVGIDSVGSAFAQLSVNSNTAQFAPPPQSPPTQFYPPHYNSNSPNLSSPYSPPVQSPYLPHATSPPPPPAPSPGMYPQYYGSPTGYVYPQGYPGYAYGPPHGYSTGNVTTTTISNVGNNYSVSTVYAPSPKKKKKAERV